MQSLVSDILNIIGLHIIGEASYNIKQKITNLRNLFNLSQTCKKLHHNYNTDKFWKLVWLDNISKYLPEKDVRNAYFEFIKRTSKYNSKSILNLSIINGYEKFLYLKPKIEGVRWIEFKRDLNFIGDVIVSGYIDINKDKKRLSVQLILSDKLDIAKSIWQKYGEIEFKKQTDLYSILNSKLPFANFELAEFLMDKGLTYNPVEVLKNAAYKYKLNVLNYLISRHQFEVKDYTIALCKAATRCHDKPKNEKKIKICQFLLDKGASIGLINQHTEKYHILNHACSYDDIELLQFWYVD